MKSRLILLLTNDATVEDQFREAMHYEGAKILVTHTIAAALETTCARLHELELVARRQGGIQVTPGGAIKLQDPKIALQPPQGQLARPPLRRIGQNRIRFSLHTRGRTATASR